MKRFFDAVYRRTGLVEDAGQRSVASQVTAIVVEGAIVFSLLGTLGVDTSPLITAAGVTGATIGFASKDFGANFVASLALSGHAALRTGNRVVIGSGVNVVSGEVKDWDTRYLYLVNDKGHVLSVPNNLILNSVVTLEKLSGGGKTPVAALWAERDQQQAHQQQQHHHHAPQHGNGNKTEAAGSKKAIE